MLKESSNTNRLMILAIIGVCLVLVCDFVALASGMGLVSQSTLVNFIPLLEILAASGFVLIGLGFHKLYVVYLRVQCRIAFLGFILSPILFLMRIIPQLIAYNIWFYFAANLVIPLLGVMAFFSLRSEGTVPFILTAVIVLFGALIDLLSYLFSFGGIVPIIDFELTLLIRSAGRIPMWIFVGATFVWTYKKSQPTQSIATGLEPE